MHPSEQHAEGIRPEASDLDGWTLAHARLVAFKAERLLSGAQRELGGFGEGALSSDLAPDLVQASEHVGEALSVLAHLREQLQTPSS